jgi:hypothetical protein
MTAVLANDQFAELLAICSSASVHSEGGRPYILLPKLRLPEGCEPSEVDALLSPEPHDGYSSRLYFAVQIKPVGKENTTALNWNGNPGRILERNWHAHSWRTPEGLRLSQMVAIHLKALR